MVGRCRRNSIKKKKRRKRRCCFCGNRGALSKKAVETAEEYIKKLKGMTEKFVDWKVFQDAFEDPTVSACNGISLALC